MKKSLALVISAICIAFSVGIVATTASAAPVVTDYTLSEHPVGLAVSGTYAYSPNEYSFNTDGTVARVDLTTGTVNNAWASISRTGLDLVKPMAIQIVGSFAYVASSVRITSTGDSKVYVSKIPLNNPAGIVIDWAVVQGSTPATVYGYQSPTPNDLLYYDYVTSMTSDSTDIYVAYYANDGYGNLYTAVRRISLATGSMVADWVTGQNFDKANAIAVNNGWIYTLNNGYNGNYSTMIGCADIGTPGLLNQCQGYGNPSSFSLNAIAFIGNTAYISFDDPNASTPSSELRSFSVSGDTFTPSTNYSLGWGPGTALTVAGNVLYTTGYGTVIQIDPSSSSPVTNPLVSLTSYQAPNGIFVSSGVIYLSTKSAKTITKITFPAPSTTITPTSQALTGTAGTAFTSGTITASGFSSTVTYSIFPSLPSGLTLNTSTGEITGTPSGALSTTSYTITATGTETATVTITLTFAAASNSNSGGSNSNNSNTNNSNTNNSNTTPANTASSATTELGYTGNQFNSGMFWAFLLISLGSGLVTTRFAARKLAKK